ncbi:hypothetical protein L249_0169 [Ophiocordyceps polyrhachis-furcata BCC 54312]|uniref:Major facilitator superfamily (MFS) profile domain-containing protein n=1 Tax=Ophiocordyceps polyrhachis-furcata BCC 54312 TaxID=1330021 RepID=A0A367LDP5_9HYPO|nr:hypothetical protein L249_0169 [Ophiocordyceps polyrhachis-furcata BCC 54312]
MPGWEQLRGRSLMLTVSLVTCLGFMLIGYDNGLMGGLVDSPAFNSTFDHPKPRMIGLIVAIFEIGCFLGSIGAAIFGERLGRRWTIGLGCWIMMAGAVLQAAAYSRAQLILGRVVSGVGVGIVNSTVPVLQAEFSPKASRGLSTLNFGIFVVYWINYAFSPRTDSWAWRMPVILQCCIIIPILVALMLIPETARWLAAHDRPDDCLAVLARMHAAPTTDVGVRSIHCNILRTVALESSACSGSWRSLLHGDQLHSRTRLLIACAIQSFQQLGGINAVICETGLSLSLGSFFCLVLLTLWASDYTNTLFQKSVGFGPRTAALMSGYLQTWFFVASFIPWLLIDRIGRKPLFLSMISLMAGAMATQAGLICQIENKTDAAHVSGIAAAVMLFVFQGAFTIGFQATVWVYPSEILPLGLRQKGSSLSTAANWIFNYMIVQMTPIAIDNIGWRTYIIFAVFNAIWVPIIFFCFPETKGLELEEVDRLFAGNDFEEYPMTKKRLAVKEEGV